MLHMLLSLAEWERETIRDRIKAGGRPRRRRGEDRRQAPGAGLREDTSREGLPGRRQVGQRGRQKLRGEPGYYQGREGRDVRWLTPLELTPPCHIPPIAPSGSVRLLARPQGGLASYSRHENRRAAMPGHTAPRSASVCTSILSHSPAPLSSHTLPYIKKGMSRYGRGEGGRQALKETQRLARFPPSTPGALVGPANPLQSPPRRPFRSAFQGTPPISTRPQADREPPVPPSGPGRCHTSISVSSSAMVRPAPVSPRSHWGPRSVIRSTSPSIPAPVTRDSSTCASCSVTRSPLLQIGVDSRLLELELATHPKLLPVVTNPLPGLLGALRTGPAGLRYVDYPETAMGSRQGQDSGPLVVG